MEAVQVQFSRARFLIIPFRAKESVFVSHIFSIDARIGDKNHGLVYCTSHRCKLDNFSKSNGRKKKVFFCSFFLPPVDFQM